MLALLPCWLVAGAAEAPQERFVTGEADSSIQPAHRDRQKASAGTEPGAPLGQGREDAAENVGGVPDAAVEPGGRRANIGLCDGS